MPTHARRLPPALLARFAFVLALLACVLGVASVPASAQQQGQEESPASLPPIPAPPGAAFTQEIPADALLLFARALKHGEAGRLDAAIALLRQATKIFPDYFDARFTLGNTLARTERYDEAIIELEHARRVNPRDDRVYENFGRIMQRQKKPHVARLVFAEAVRLNPRNYQSYLLLATALIDLSPPENHFAEAEQHLVRAFDLSDRQLYVVYFQRARLYERRGEPGRAADELTEYLSKQPASPYAAAIREAIKRLRATPAAPRR